jgi:hypothetical protein
MGFQSQTLVSFKKYMSLPLSYFKVNICPFPLPQFASIFFAYLWSFRWPNYIVTLPIYFSFRLSHLNIPTWSPSDKLDMNIQRTSLGLLFSQSSPVGRPPSSDWLFCHFRCAHVKKLPNLCAEYLQWGYKRHWQLTDGGKPWKLQDSVPQHWRPLEHYNPW